jgi:hypothetical protein
LGDIWTKLAHYFTKRLVTLANIEEDLRRSSSSM